MIQIINQTEILPEGCKSSEKKDRERMRESDTVLFCTVLYCTDIRAST